MGSRSQGLIAELGIHYLTVDCANFQMKKSRYRYTHREDDIIDSKVMFTTSVHILLLEYLIERLDDTLPGYVLGKVLGGCLMVSALTILCCA